MPVPVRRGVPRNEIEVSPRRRSIAPQFASTPLIQNDDDVERSRRRSISELQRRVSNLAVDSDRSDNEAPEMNASKLHDHFQTCVKLFTENKINAKNAWNVHILEYMQAMLKKELIVQNNIKEATTSIDIGCKVYCIKVDQVHNDLFKLAGAMVRANEENENRNQGDDNDDDEADEVETEGNKKKEKKKKKVRKSLDNQDCEITVAKDEESLNGNIVPHNTAMQQVSSGKNRLYTLSMITKPKWGYEQMVNIRSKFPYFTQLNSVENVELSDQKVPATIPSATSHICPSFTDFIINNWQPDDDDVPLGTQQATNRSQNSLVYDENGLPIPDLDASVHYSDDQPDAFHDDVEEDVETGVGHEVFRRPVAFITEMRPGQGPLSDVPLQYSYRSAPVVSERYMLSGVWAGPSHWKIKALQRPARNTGAESVNSAPQRGKRLKKAEPEFVHFDLESDVEEEDVPNKNKKKKRVRRGSLSKVTLPEDLCITLDDICRLKNRPSVHINLENSAGLDAADSSQVNLDMTGNYQYDNPDDANYCSQHSNDNADHDGDDHNQNDDMANDVLQQTITDDNMVIPPSQVQKFQVPYATQAKRMDMRKLKDAIWKSMIINETGNDHIEADDENLKAVKLNNVPFSKMYKTLPSQVTSRMAEDLTAPLTFVALLHLTNEETLNLEGTLELNDIFISTTK